MKKIILIGAGGHCKVIIDIIKSTNEYEVVGITDKNYKDNIFGVEIIGNDMVLQEIYSKGIKYAFICIGEVSNSNIRNVIYNKVVKIGFKFPVLIHKTAIISPFSNIEEGTCVMAGAIVNPGVNVGKNCIINTGSIIEHDCKIGDNTHISPGVAIAGNVTIGDNTHIGIGSSVIQGKSIGNNVTIGAGAAVIDNIEDNSVVVGVPAKIIRIKK